MADEEILKKIHDALVDGDDVTAPELCKDALSKGISATDILTKACMPGMTKAGEMFASGLGGASMTDLIMCGEAMKNCSEVLKPKLVAEKAESKMLGKFLIGQMEGDIHDIGRNIVTAMMGGSGWEVTDMGLDIPPETIVEKAKEINATIVGGACAITGSLDKLATIRQLIDKEKLPCGFIIGGWSTSEGYAKEIGAAFGRDVLECIKVCEEIVKKKA